MSRWYLLAFLCSPLAIAVSGRPVQAGINLGLWVLGLVVAPSALPLAAAVAVAHAVLVVRQAVWDQHLEAMVQRVAVSRPVELRTRTRASDLRPPRGGW